MVDRQRPESRPDGSRRAPQPRALDHGRIVPPRAPERRRSPEHSWLLRREWLPERDWSPRRDGAQGRRLSFQRRLLADALSDVGRAFRIWRRTRPFWGGLFVVGGACEILASERGPLQLVIHIGIQGLAGYLIPVMLLLCGVLLWFNPAQRAFYSLLSIVLALGSWITSNLGGFFIGMMLGLVGGALAFAWATASNSPPQLRWFRGDPQVLHPSWGQEVILRPTAVLPPASPYPSAPAAEIVPYSKDPYSDDPGG